MSAPELALAALFWTCVAGIVYTYAVYPGVVWLLSRSLGRRPVRPVLADADLPRVSVLVAAYNEAAVIGDRVRTALAADYPRDRLEIVIASDGSTDGTDDIVRRYARDGVRLLEFAPRRGKASVLNDAFGQLTGDVVVLSDANTHTDPAAVRRLAAWFADPAVGAVCGKLVLTDPVTGRNADGLYWRYETFLKACEGRLGALLGANGGIYAVRRCLVGPLPANTIVDDFVLPLSAKLRTGCRIVYDPGAVAREESAPGIGAEFHRRARIGAGGFQSIVWLRGLLNPRHGWTAFAFLSHKVLRWLCPFFMVGALATSLALAGHRLYAAGLAAQAALYLTAGLAAVAPAHLRLARPFRLTTMFTVMNAALLVGFWRWVSGVQNPAWKRTARAAAQRPVDPDGARPTGPRRTATAAITSPDLGSAVLSGGPAA